MATFLYRVGRLSFGRRRLVAATWLMLLVAAGLGAATLSGTTTDSFTIPGSSSQQAIAQLTRKFPQAAAGGATARVVFAAPKGHTLNDFPYRAAVEGVTAELKIAPQVANVTDPFRAGGLDRSGTIGYSQVTYQVAAAGLNHAAKQSLLEAVAQGRQVGLTVEVGGDALRASAETGGTELIGVAVAAVVLLITFGSLVAAGLPLLTAIIGIGIAISSITALTGFMDLSSTTSAMALMIGLAVAIDYALFIMSRYRHELAVGRDPREAAGRAVGTAGSAVVFAGLTVVIALAGLSVVGIPFLTQMGLAAAGAVAVAVLIALTLLPALLGFTGHRVHSRATRTRDPERDSDSVGKPSMGLRWAAQVTRRPAAVLVVAGLGLAVVAIPARDLRLGLPDDGMAAPGTTERSAYDLITEGFGAGVNGPLVIVIDASRSADPKSAARQVTDTIKGLPDVAAVSPALFNPAGDTVLAQVIPRSGPNDPATTSLVKAIRSHTFATTGVAVTGLTAVNIDVSDKLSAAMLPYLLLVAGLAFILLMLVFRSILVPFKATLGFLLTIAASLGAVVAVFQWGWLAGLFGVDQPGPIVSFMPILMIGVVFGLAMDYEVFLVTRMREEYIHATPAVTSVEQDATAIRAVVVGFGHSARVVTAAAIIMISVFAGFVLSANSAVMMIGFGLAVGVLIDAFVVRMTIVPAALALVGRAAWWLPDWLDKILPKVDVEGEQLRRLDAPAERAATPPPTARDIARAID
ncbi:MAG: MMPL family transporter [Actinomycetota bacterium]